MVLRPPNDDDDDKQLKDELEQRRDPAWRRFAEELKSQPEAAEEALRGVGIHGAMLVAANAVALAKAAFEEAARYPFTTMDADRQLRVAERMLLIAEVATRVARNIEGK